MGIDLVSLKRFERALANGEAAFVKRIGHAKEITQAKNLKQGSGRYTEYWAARFAAKEALAKALGTGLGAKLSFHDAFVVKDKKGKPSFQFSKKLQKFLKEKNISKAHLSITHAEEHAAAFVVLESSVLKR